MKIEHFEDLDCWKDARELAKVVYRATKQGSFKQDFSLTDQARRAATSIMANIAEGFSRQSDREFAQFLFISKSSASELQSHLYVALDQDYVESSLFETLYSQLEVIQKRISSLIKYLKSGQLRPRTP